jgi:hypothetical protein
VLAAVALVAVFGVTGHQRAAWPLTLCIAAMTVAMFLVRGDSLV